MFWSNDFWPSYGPWILKFSQIFSCHLFFSLCLEILTWFLIYECIMMSYRSSLHFIPVQWFLALGLWNLAKYLVVTILFHYNLIDIDLIFGIWVYNDELQIKFTFPFGPMIFGRVMQSSWNLFSCVSHLVWYPSEFRFCIMISYRSALKFTPVEWFLANLQLLGFEIWPNI